MLVSFGGQAITYDNIGNPINYLGNTMSWTGRQLDSITKADGTQIAYTYDLDGIRTKKTVNGVTTEYFVNGTTILAQKTGNDIIWFIYDSDGQILGFTYNDIPYYYVKNIQGDIVRIVNGIGATVATYTYDPWGKVTSCNGTMAEINPIRYRGYYYDSETGLYYLNSRYYDPDTCRFINADDVSLLGINGDFASYNLFAYCGNNPVNRYDADGCFWKRLKELGKKIVEVAAVAAKVVVKAAVVGTAAAVVGTAALIVGTGGAAAVALAPAIVAAKAVAITAVGVAATAAVGATAIAVGTAGENFSYATQSEQYAGKSKTLKDGNRIDYEYNGNGTGNIHIKGEKIGENKIWYFNNGVENYYELPKKVSAILADPSAQRVIDNFIKTIKSLSGF